MSFQAFAQEFTQTVRGKVLDEDSKSSLVGAMILLESDSTKGCLTDENGEFRLENVSLGRVSLKILYVGYETKIIPDISVVSGKETILEVKMKESITELEEIVVSATEFEGDPINEMALISAMSISSEMTNRYAGGFNDPARIMSNFAGINNSQDGSADIIVRGNSPKYLQWRLEGVTITNPNHFANPSGLGSNGISTLNNNILSTSDFYTSVFPAEFGDALSGVYDVRLRAGNNEKFEGIIGVGVVGTDVTLEGPFKKGYGGSFLVNYRFTTTTIVDALGLFPDIGGIPKFQDGAFKIMLPTKKLGTFSIFGLAGTSSITFEDIDPGVLETPGDNVMNENIQEDFKKSTYLANTGLNYTLPLGTKNYLKATLMFSSDGIQDKVMESVVQDEDILSTVDNFKSKISNSVYRFNLSYNSKLNPKNSIRIGVNYALKNQKFDISQLDASGNRIKLVDFNENIGTLKNFISWKHRFNEKLSMVAGVHNMNVLYNSKSTIEPRIAMKWKLNNSNIFSIGYGMHSSMESIHNYFAKVQLANGSITEPNQDLDLLKAHHFVLGYQKRFNTNLRAKIEVYYQDLYNLPVENSTTSSYSTINETLDIRYVDLVNKGTGKNYGVEITLEKSFSKKYYFLVNASIFDSKYTALDGVERNTAFNSNYLANLLFGKEFTQLGKKKNQTFAINTKLFFGGGKRIVPLLRDGNGQLAVNPSTNTYWDYDKAYEKYLDDIYTITLSLSYKWNRPKRTHELFLNIDNLTNNKPRLSEYYGPSESGSVGYLTPVGVFPNLMYRLYL